VSSFRGKGERVTQSASERRSQRPRKARTGLPSRVVGKAQALRYLVRTGVAVL